MDLVTLENGNAVTTSLAIAEGVEKTHKTVIQLVRDNKSDLEEFGSLAFQMRVSRSDGKGGQQQEFAILNEQQSTLLMTYMRNNDIVRAFKKRLVKAFYELAHQKPSAITEIDWSDTNQLAGLMLQSFQKVQEQQQLIAQKDEKIAKDAPKVSFYDKFASEDGLYGLQNAARILKQGPNLFPRMLKQEGYLFYQGSALVPKIKYINQGIFELKSTIVDDKARYRTWVTPKGLQYFAKKLNVEIEEAA